MKHQSNTRKEKKKKEKNESRVLCSNQITSPSSAGPAPPPSSLSLSLFPQHSLSLHPLCERHAEAVGSLCRVWGCERLLFRSVTADREQLTQGQGKRGQSPESRSAQLSQPGIRSAFQLRGREREKLRHRQEKDSRESAPVTARDK